MREGVDEGEPEGIFDSVGLVDGYLEGELDGALLKDGPEVGLMTGLEI